MDITELLTAAVEAGASDLHLKSGNYSMMRVHGVLRPIVTERRFDQAAIAAGTSQYGMQTFDQAIHGLYQDGRVSYDTALRWASNRDEFTIRLQGVTSTADGARDEMADARPGNTGEPPVITRFGE